MVIVSIFLTLELFKRCLNLVTNVSLIYGEKKQEKRSLFNSGYRWQWHTPTTSCVVVLIGLECFFFL